MLETSPLDRLGKSVSVVDEEFAPLSIPRLKVEPVKPKKFRRFIFLLMKFPPKMFAIIIIYGLGFANKIVSDRE